LGGKCAPNSFGNSAGAVVRNDEERERFSSFWMLRRAGSALVNAGDGRHLRFNFPKADSDTANLYELASAPFDPQVSVVVTEGGSSRRPGHVSLIDHAGLAVASVWDERWRAFTPRVHNWQSRGTIWITANF